MKYNLQGIMTHAWTLHRKFGITFSEALHRGWLSEKAYPINAQRIKDAQTAAGISEECNTWYVWKVRGFEVQHGSKALFGARLIWGSRGDGAVYEARFFGASQVREVV